MSTVGEEKSQNKSINAPTMSLVERLRADLLSAMKARQSRAVVALRKMLATLDNASAVEVDSSFVPLEGITKDVPRRELSEEQLLDLLRAEADERRSALADYERLGKDDEAEQMRVELEIMARYFSFFSSKLARKKVNLDGHRLVTAGTDRLRPGFNIEQGAEHR